jgi:hypothetical protein
MMTGALFGLMMRAPQLRPVNSVSVWTPMVRNCVRPQWLWVGAPGGDMIEGIMVTKWLNAPALQRIAASSWQTNVYASVACTKTGRPGDRHGSGA